MGFRSPPSWMESASSRTLSGLVSSLPFLGSWRTTCSSFKCTTWAPSFEDREGLNCGRAVGVQGKADVGVIGLEPLAVPGGGDGDAVGLSELEALADSGGGRLDAFIVP